MNVNIYGAGIAGLTTAHELIEKGFNVTIYESNNIVGGMARSFRNSDGIPTEHSWRGYGPFYYNTFDILKRIPIDSPCPSKEHFQNIQKNQINNNDNTRVYSLNQIKTHNKRNDLWTYYKGNVYNITNFIKSHPGGDLILKSGGNDLEKVLKENHVDWHFDNSSFIKILKEHKIGVLDNYDKFLISNKKDYLQTSEYSAYDNLNKNGIDFDLLYNEVKDIKYGEKLSKRDYPYMTYLLLKIMTSDIRLKDYYKTQIKNKFEKSLSKSSMNYMLDYISGPGYGFDRNTMSYGHLFKFIEFNMYNFDYWKVMNKPTNEAWFDYWVLYLKSKGVVFKFNQKLNKIIYSNNKIVKTIVKNQNTDIDTYADIHIVALSPFAYKEVLLNSEMLAYNSIYEKLNTINNQISFRIGFNKKIKLDKNNKGFVFADSPYNITLYFQEDHWCNNTKLDKSGDIKTLISGTIIIPYNKGILYNKSALSLTINELKNEIIEQIYISKEFKELIKKYNNFELDKKDIIYTEIFEDWYYDSESKLLKTRNKKWVNNVFNEEYRPGYKTIYDNLFICGSHCKTSVNVWSMESAVESGKILSNIILKKYDKKQCYIYKHNSIMFFKIFQILDNILYLLKMPNIIDSILILIIILLIIKLIKKY